MLCLVSDSELEMAQKASQLYTQTMHCFNYSISLVNEIFITLYRRKRAHTDWKPVTIATPKQPWICKRIRIINLASGWKYHQGTPNITFQLCMNTMNLN